MDGHICNGNIITDTTNPTEESLTYTCSGPPYLDEWEQYGVGSCQNVNGEQVDAGTWTWTGENETGDYVTFCYMNDPDVCLVLEDETSCYLMDNGEDNPDYDTWINIHHPYNNKTYSAFEIDDIDLHISLSNDILSLLGDTQLIQRMTFFIQNKYSNKLIYSFQYTDEIFLRGDMNYMMKMVH